MLKQIKSSYKVTEIPDCLGKNDRLTIECNHGDCDVIGQFALRGFSNVQTYFACHLFKRGRLTIYFKNPLTRAEIEG